MLQGLLATIADLATFNALSRAWSAAATVAFLLLICVIAVVTR